MDDLRKLFGIRLRRLRLNRGYTQETLAELVGISVDFLSLIERGVNAPSFDNITKLSLALDVPIKQFFDFSFNQSQASESVINALNPNGFNVNCKLPHGLTIGHIRNGMQDFLDFIGFINPKLQEEGIQKLESMLMPANFSSMVGEFMKSSIPRYCAGLVVNEYHNGHPDLIPTNIYPNNSVQHGEHGIEIKGSRYTSGWQGHNPENAWLLVFVFDSNRPVDKSNNIPARPFQFVKVVGAQLFEEDWKFSGRSKTSRRTITASVRPSGRAKMEQNWIYRQDPPL